MAERYIKLFSLPKQEQNEDLHSPVEISAGTLFLDNQNGIVFTLLKYKNISSKSIKSLTVNISAFDGTGAKISGVNDFEYEGLIANPGDFFGDKTQIKMSDNNTHAFTADVIRVEFSDGTSWSKFNQKVAKVATGAAKSAVETAKDVGEKGVAVAKGTVKISALIVNIVFTAVMVLATFATIRDLIDAPSARLAVAAVLVGLATIVTAPGLSKLVLYKKIGKKHRIVKWGILIALLIIDILIMTFVF